MSKAPKISIIHLQQQHQPPFTKTISPEIQEAVAYSQYHVAMRILEHKKAIVLKESLYEDFNPTIFAELSRKDPQLFSSVKKIFPNGIPSSFDELKPSQKTTFVTHGGSEILFYLGYLTHIYKTSSKEECKLVDDGIAKKDENLATLMFETREKQALHWAQQAAIESGKTQILLVFGAGHDFTSRISELKDSTIAFEKTIDTTIPRSTRDKRSDPAEPYNPSGFFKGKKVNRYLEEALVKKGLQVLIDQKLITLDRLIHLSAKSPWITKTLPKALHRTCFFSALTDKMISLEQIANLYEHQVDCLITRIDEKEIQTQEQLKLAVEESQKEKEGDNLSRGSGLTTCNFL